MTDVMHLILQTYSEWAFVVCLSFYENENNQSAAGAAGLGIIRGKKVGNVEFALS